MKILVTYYTLYGHTLDMAHAVADGAREVSGTDVKLRRVPEFDAVEKVIEAEACATIAQHHPWKCPKSRAG
jgi:NAD(P)H dehydrogenase (quinone)